MNTTQVGALKKAINSQQNLIGSGVYIYLLKATAMVMLSIHATALVIASRAPDTIPVTWHADAQDIQEIPPDGLGELWDLHQRIDVEAVNEYIKNLRGGFLANAGKIGKVIDSAFRQSSRRTIGKRFSDFAVSRYEDVIVSIEKRLQKPETEEPQAIASSRTTAASSSPARAATSSGSEASSGSRTITSAAPSSSGAGEHIPQTVADYFGGRGETWMLDLDSLRENIRRGQVKENIILRALARAYLDDVPLSDLVKWARIMTLYGLGIWVIAILFKVVGLFVETDREVANR